MERGQWKRMQAREVGQLGRGQGRITRQGWLETYAPRGAQRSNYSSICLVERTYSVKTTKR